MSQKRICPECGAELPTESAEGLCPKSLLKAGLEQSTIGGDANTEAPTIAPSPSQLSDVQTVASGSLENPAREVGTKVRYFGDYELLDEVARGGMGVVYKARQVSLNRTVALKMILAGQLAGPDDVLRFHTEAEAAAQLNHPGIVPIYEVGEHESQHYFSMEFVQGKSLADKIKDGPLTARLAAEYTKKVAEAMAYAHERGVIHRDLKPANVLLDQNDEPKVTDFGLAKRFEDDSGLTATGQILGTPSFMPPEQASGKIDEITETADVYSLGAILYTLVTGRPPFQAASHMDTLLQVLDHEPVSPRTLNSHVPQDLETVCLKCLEKDSRRRYSGMRLFAEELDRFLTGQPVLARPVSVVVRAGRWCARNRVIATLAASSLALLLIVALVSGIGYLTTSDALTRAQQNLYLATAMRLAAQSQSIRNELPVQSLLLGIEAIEATRRHGGAILPLAHQSLLDGLARVSGRPFVGHEGEVTSVAISPNGRWLVTGSYDKTARLWDLTSEDAAASAVVLRGHEDALMSVAISADGRWLVSGSYDKTARLWDLNIDSLIESARRQAGRELTPQERKQYLLE